MISILLSKNINPLTSITFKLFNNRIIRSIFQTTTWKNHNNFKPDTLTNTGECNYRILKIKRCYEYFNLPPLVFGLTGHAVQRMSQRKISPDMVSHTLKYGKLDYEEPQKLWDTYGRAVFTWENMVVVTNYEKNRIVTVFWKIDDWSELHISEKPFAQNKARRKWCKKYSKFFNNNEKKTCF